MTTDQKKKKLANSRVGNIIKVRETGGAEEDEKRAERVRKNRKKK